MRNLKIRTKIALFYIFFTIIVFLPIYGADKYKMFSKKTAHTPELEEIYFRYITSANFYNEYSELVKQNSNDIWLTFKKNTEQLNLFSKGFYKVISYMSFFTFDGDETYGTITYDISLVRFSEGFMGTIFYSNSETDSYGIPKETKLFKTKTEAEEWYKNRCNYFFSQYK